MPQVIGRASRRIDGTEKIEMDVPFSRLAVLIKEVKYSSWSVLFIKPATTILVICKTPREVRAGGECRFNQRPGAKREPDAVKPVNVMHAAHEVPKAFRAHSVQQQQ